MITSYTADEQIHGFKQIHSKTIEQIYYTYKQQHVPVKRVWIAPASAILLALL